MTAYLAFLVALAFVIALAYATRRRRRRETRASHRAKVDGQLLREFGGRKFTAGELAKRERGRR